MGDGYSRGPLPWMGGEAGDVRKKDDGALRDWFAGQALLGLIASNDRGAGDRIEDIPAYAYNIADAMLVERTKRE